MAGRKALARKTTELSMTRFSSLGGRTEKASGTQCLDSSKAGRRFAVSRTLFIHTDIGAISFWHVFLRRGDNHPRSCSGNIVREGTTVKINNVYGKDVKTARNPGTNFNGGRSRTSLAEWNKKNCEREELAAAVTSAKQNPAFGSPIYDRTFVSSVFHKPFSELIEASVDTSRR